MLDDASENDKVSLQSFKTRLNKKKTNRCIPSSIPSMLTSGCCFPMTDRNEYDVVVFYGGNIAGEIIN